MSTLGNVVSKFAPIVGSALNLVLPGSGLLVSGLMSLFGVTSNNPDELTQVISQDPNAALKLKQFEIEHQDILAKMTQADRASARDMAVATVQKTGKQDWVMHFLACICIFGAMAYGMMSILAPHQFDKGLFHDILNIAMLPLLFYFGGVYKP